MEIIEFNGLGHPSNKDVKLGSILILVQNEDVDIVKLIPHNENEWGPVFQHAINQNDYFEELITLVKTENKNQMCEEKDYILLCPKELADKAIFK